MRLFTTVRRSATGFSLIEMMITLAIMGLIIGLAAPSIIVFVNRANMRAIGGDFTLAMQRARAEAINKNQCVAICMSTTVGGTNRCATSGSNWASGWIIFTIPSCGSITATRPNTGLTPPDVILMTREASNTRYELNAGSGTRAVTFNSRGLPSTSTIDAFNLVDTTIPLSDPMNRAFCLDVAGRIRTADIGGC